MARAETWAWRSQLCSAFRGVKDSQRDSSGGESCDRRGDKKTGARSFSAFPWYKEGDGAATEVLLGGGDGVGRMAVVDEGVSRMAVAEVQDREDGGCTWGPVDAGGNE